MKNMFYDRWKNCVNRVSRETMKYCTRYDNCRHQFYYRILAFENKFADIFISNFEITRNYIFLKLNKLERFN